MNSPALRQEPVEEESLEASIAARFDEMSGGEEYDSLAPEGDPPEQDLETEQPTEQPTEQQVDQALDQVDYNEPAPERWPEEIKTAYNSLPPAGKRAMLEGVFKPMQRQYGQVTTELAGMRKTIEPMLQSLSQYRADFERLGMDPITTINNQIAWAAHLARVGPEQGLRDMQAAYGLNQQQQTQGQGYLTPAEREMKAKLENVERHINQQLLDQQNARQQQEQQVSQRRYQEVQQGLHSFINEQIDGKPAHPYVEKLSASIAGIIRGGLVNKFTEAGEPVPIREQLQKAYNMACNLDPSIRAAVGTPRQAERAKAAQDVNVVTKVARGKPDDDSIFDLTSAISDTYDQLAKRRA